MSGSKPLKANCSRISTGEALPRSSHSLSITNGRAYIFGGEVEPRQPVDNSIHVLTLPSSSVAEADYQVIPARSATDNDEVPAARVGHAAATIAQRIYVFGGRGGVQMEPLEENGRVWMFDSRNARWSALDPMPNTPVPSSRSYHASTWSEHPLPDPRDRTMHPIVADGTVHPPETSDGHGTMFIHGGCDASGNRLTDVWAYDVAARTWSPFPDTPQPGRGGTGLAFVQDRLYRFGGFDGTCELGGQLDYLDVKVSTFNDKGGIGELCLSSLTGNWEKMAFDASIVGPGPRSVAGLQPVTTGQGRSYLLLFFGERSPSSSGHQGAGIFWDDIWSFQLPPEGMTGASFKDAAKLAVGKATDEGQWAKAEVVAQDEHGDPIDVSDGYGWFASARSDIDPATVITWGGVDADNRRIGHGWALRVT